MNELLRAEMYRTLREKEAQQRLDDYAKSLADNPKLVQIDWSEFKDRPALPLWKLAALSAGINPMSLPKNATQVAGLVSGEAGERLREMLKRLDVVVWNLEKNGGELRVAINVETDVECAVRIKDFKDFADGKNWELPDCFPFVSHSKSIKTEDSSPKDKRAKLDITNERGCRRKIIEHWNEIEGLYGPHADGRQVMIVLKRGHNEWDGNLPALKTVRNTLSDLKRDGLIP